MPGKAKLRAVKSNGSKSKKKPTIRERNQVMHSYDYADCRLLGHAWPPLQLQTMASIGNGLIEIIAVCEWCDTERIDLRTMHGHLHNRSYYRPSDYLFKGYGELAPTRDEWWEQQLAGPKKIKAVAL